ncbi:ethanolamine kinase [Acrasis kona]|uniref:ethanolamine kinase n=1 Tax=Acrasis kona TaxID=1008807 RepID=A0AAW2YVZ0_9EUKA
MSKVFDRTFELHSSSIVEELREFLTKDVFVGEEVKEFGKLTGGLTNLLYKAKVGDKTVLVRINGVGTETIIDRDKEIEYMLLLGEHRLSAEIYAIYNNGYVYEFIEGEALSPEEMPLHAELIAKKVAEFHDAPITPKTGDKSPTVFKTIKRWLNDVKSFEYKGEKKEKMAKIDLNRLYKETEDLEQLLKNCEVGFCHNDLLSLNILYNKENNQINFIDYEYCGYNYRSFDIGNHFSEHAGFDLKFDRFPDHNQQKKFVSAYLEGRHAKKPSDEEVEKLVAEVGVFSNIANIFWGVWALSQAYHSEIDFDYLDYGGKKINWFYERKDELDRNYRKHNQ